jgi:hypothetical protein
VHFLLVVGCLVEEEFLVLVVFNLQPVVHIPEENYLCAWPFADHFVQYSYEGLVSVFGVVLVRRQVAVYEL